MEAGTLGRVFFIKSVSSEMVSISSPASSMGLAEDSRLREELLNHKVFSDLKRPVKGIRGNDSHPVGLELVSLRQLGALLHQQKFQCPFLSMGILERYACFIKVGIRLQYSCINLKLLFSIMKAGEMQG